MNRDNLFNIEETRSPRLKWLDRHKIRAYRCEFDHGGPSEPDELWRARKAGSVMEGVGPTMDDAIVDLAKQLNLTLWNES